MSEQARSTHGRNRPGARARFAGPDTTVTLPKVTDQTANLRIPPFIPPLEDTPTVVMGTPAWATEITKQFFPPAVGRARVTERPPQSNVPPPGELLHAGLDAAMAAINAKNSQTLTDYLDTHRPPKPQDASLTDLISQLGAHFVRLGVGADERLALLNGLAINPRHIYKFYIAFSGAKDLSDAVNHLPWERTQKDSR